MKSRNENMKHIEKPVPMLDLVEEYHSLKDDVDTSLQNVLERGDYINGKEVQQFNTLFSDYLGAKRVISCANGTEALQLALMSLNLQKGDEVIIPSFTYIASVEVVALLGYTPVLIDVNPDTFLLDIEELEEAYTNRTRAIIAVHLFGQCVDMESLLKWARKKGIWVIEDVAQATGAVCKIEGGKKQKAGVLADIACFSFFPTKNLACYGDGGAVSTNNLELGDRIHMLANHGQYKKYEHHLVGCNSRLDTLQAAILLAKLPYLDKFNLARNKIAQRYDEALSPISSIQIPQRLSYSSHVFHQYTIKLREERDALKNFLEEKGIATMVYYPKAVHQQKGYKNIVTCCGKLPNASLLTEQVLSLPISPFLSEENQEKIISLILKFYAK